MSAVKESPTKMYRFELSSAYRQLELLAEQPIDLTIEGSLTPERLTNFQAKACGFHFLYGTERVTNETIKALKMLSEEAFAIQMMEKMQAGEITNTSEQRQVLHTATRDFFDQPNPFPKAKEAAHLAKKEYDKLQAFIQKTTAFTDLILVGIGGSELGPKAHYYALQAFQLPKKRVHFVGNVDPDDLASVIGDLDLKTTLVAVVSKGGETLETLTNEALLRELFQKEDLPPENHFCAVTLKNSPMDQKNRYLEIFYLYDWIGGRFCTTSTAGGIVLSFAFGMEVFTRFLQGAHAMDLVALSSNLQENLPLLGALLGIWNRNFLGFPLLAVVPYAAVLHRYPAHIQQLDMESNGKHIDKRGERVPFETGPIIFGEPGTNAQHSFYQLLHQGTTIVPMEFIGFKEAQFGKDVLFQNTTSQEKLIANLFAQMLALAKGDKSNNPNKEFLGNRPSHLLLAKRLDPYTLGALLAYFEHKIAFQGFIWNINSFDQEGVQLGKRLATELTANFAHKRDPKISAPSFPLGEALLNI